VAAELWYGAPKRGSKRLTRQLEVILSALEIFPLDAPADRRCGELRTHLEKHGATTGPNDMLIASQALSLELALVTANVREFSRVPTLAMQNWLVEG
jgi:tRNA(fMet)-specific endonuclease VapC